MSLDARSDELDKKMVKNDIDSSIQALVIGARRQRRAVRLLALSIALDFILTVGLTVVSFKTNEIANLAQNNRDAVIANCETANDSRKNQLTLWSYIFAILPSEPPDPQQQVQTQEFKSFVQKTFSQRNCQAEIKK